KSVAIVHQCDLIANWRSLFPGHGTEERQFGGARWRRRSRRRRGAAGPGGVVLGGGGLDVGAEGGGPGGVDGADGHHDPDRLLGSERRPAELQVRLRQQPVLLRRVAGPAGGNDVLPDVLTPPGAGDHVVDVLRRGAAVLAAVTVTDEDGPAG